MRVQSAGQDTLGQTFGIDIALRQLCFVPLFTAQPVVLSILGQAVKLRASQVTGNALASVLGVERANLPIPLHKRRAFKRSVPNNKYETVNDLTLNLVPAPARFNSQAIGQSWVCGLLLCSIATAPLIPSLQNGFNFPYKGKL